MVEVVVVIVIVTQKEEMKPKEEKTVREIECERRYFMSVLGIETAKI